MPILKNFKPAPKIALDDLLPDPNGILSKIVSPSAMKMDSDEVSKVVDVEGNMSMQLRSYYRNSNSLFITVHT